VIERILPFGRKSYLAIHAKASDQNLGFMICHFLLSTRDSDAGQLDRTVCKACELINDRAVSPFSFFQSVGCFVADGPSDGFTVKAWESGICIFL